VDPCVKPIKLQQQVCTRQSPSRRKSHIRAAGFHVLERVSAGQDRTWQQLMIRFGDQCCIIDADNAKPAVSCGFSGHDENI
jgi:hypothetical protein